MAAPWAYTIIDSLLREFPDNLTCIHLGAICVLGSGYGLVAG